MEAEGKAVEKGKWQQLRPGEPIRLIKPGLGSERDRKGIPVAIVGHILSTFQENYLRSWGKHEG